MKINELPKPLPEWEKLPALDRLFKIREAYKMTLNFLKSGAWIKKAEERCLPNTLSWEVLNADYYQKFPWEYPRIKWFQGQWCVLFNSFLKRVNR